MDTLSSLVKSCKECQKSFTPTNKFGPTPVFCTLKCSRKHRKRAYQESGRMVTMQRARKQRIANEGRCIGCGNALDASDSTRSCLSCRRRAAERKHKSRKSIRYYLGSKLKTTRTAFILEHVKMTNPILQQNWNEVKGWITGNVELFIDKADVVLFTAQPLETVRDSYEEVASFGLKNAQKAYWGQNKSGLSLEDYVIFKLDCEREIRVNRLEKEEAIERICSTWNSES